MTGFNPGWTACTLFALDSNITELHTVLAMPLPPQGVLSVCLSVCVCLLQHAHLHRPTLACACMHPHTHTQPHQYLPPHQYRPISHEYLPLPHQYQGLIDPQSGERACNSAYACRDGKMLVVIKNRTKRVGGWQRQLCSLR